MNLDTLTPEQRDCVTHVSGPLLVSAGAGSGKTFMLTQRVAYALLHPGESGVEDIDQILAITFTELAASEIKARVRARLREEGLADQALKVDASWISTIHGMCSRILHENALELGLDPGFGLIDELDRDQLLVDCINAALAEAGAVPDAEDEDAAEASPYGELFREYEKGDDNPSRVSGIVRNLVEAVSNVRGGLDAVVVADPPSPHDLAGDALAAMVACDAVAREGISATGKQKEPFTQKARDVLEDGEHGMIAFERLAAKKDCSYTEVADALLAVDLNFGSRTSNEPYATGYVVFKQEWVRIAHTCLLGIAAPARTELLALARRVWDLFAEAKAQRGLLDQNDLLLKTLEAFETNPALAARYRDRFRLVMVDEFQDTSGLQIALISHLTDHDRRLCTVGDTQQSIYRFRGADVATYRAHKRAMRALEAAGGLYRELGKNFRSHGDVIAFVNRVFGAPEVFGGGGEFIELDWVADHAAANPFPAVPRIDVVATTNIYHNGVDTGLRHAVEAEAIARRFAALHADAPNQRWGDMVILLGTMKRAEVYARTLRAHGIPCIVTGGSGFATTPEAQEIGTLLAAVADPWDNGNLRLALSGNAFGLGADDLYRLGRAADGEPRDLWAGLLATYSDHPSPRVRLAGALLSDAVLSAGQRGAAQTLLELAVSSGWLDRLQTGGPQGMASAANVLKAIRLAESIENEPRAPRGIPATATRLTRKLENGLTEKPGALMTEQQDAVRILTIHAAKGLEFPVVALADFYGTLNETSPLRLETAGEKVYLSLRLSASIANGMPYEGLKKLHLTDPQKERLVDAGLLVSHTDTELDEAESALELDEAIRSHAKREEFEELRRKFYVGATRPREALIVAVNMDEKEEHACTGILGDLKRGLFGENGDYATSPEGLDFGGTCRAATQRLRLDLDDEGKLRIDGEPAAGYLTPVMAAELDLLDTGTGEDLGTVATEQVPEPPRPGEFLSDLLPTKRPCDPLRAGTFSYSKLAHNGHVQGEEINDPDEVPAVEGGTDGVDAPAGGDARDARRGGGAVSTGAVAFGSALHQACQLMVEDLLARRDGTGEQGTGFEVPSDERLMGCLQAWGADEDRLPALRSAAQRWASSLVAREAAGYANLAAEAPFYVTLQGPQGEPIHLEGSIDLLCCDHRVDNDAQTALVVDYKTGGSPTETPEQLHAKHELQAMCYAYAVLTGGYTAVELRFVRVQRPDKENPSQPQVVRYRFERGQLQELEERIRAGYGGAGDL